MPRYFFHLWDSNRKDLVRDPEGALYSSACEAEKEAIGLGQDIVRHGIHRATWQVVVTGENGEHVLTIPLSELRAPKVRAWLDLAHRIATYEPRFRSQLFTWLLTAAVLAMITQSALLTQRVRESGGRSPIASVDTEAAIINVRFVPRTSVADMSGFLDAYKASLIGGPLPGGWYCLRISDSLVPHEKLEDIVSNMTKEEIVSFAVVGCITGPPYE